MFDFDELEEQDPAEGSPATPVAAAVASPLSCAPTAGSAELQELSRDDHEIQEFACEGDDVAPSSSAPMDSLDGCGLVAPEAAEEAAEAITAAAASPSLIAGEVGEQLAIGRSVTVHGLKSRADLNGRRGKITAFDATAGRYEVEIPDGGGLIRCKPENLEAMSAPKGTATKERGDDAFKAGDMRSALELYGAALAEAEADDREFKATLHSNLAATWSKEGNYHEAVEEAQEALKLRPTWSRAHSRKGFALLKLEKHKEAQESYSAAVKHEPGSDSNLAGLRQATEMLAKALPAALRQQEAESKKVAGNAALKEGDLALAVAQYTMALALQGVDGDGKAADAGGKQLAVFASNRSAAFAKLQQWNFALVDANEASRLQPAWPKAQVRKAAALQGLLYIEEAYKAYLVATGLQSNYDEAFAGLRACLGLLPMYKSPLAGRRIKRFSEDAKRPRGSCRVFAISDVHIDHGDRVVNWAKGISDTEFRNDVLIVAGDLGDTLNAIRTGIGIFKKKFRRVFYTPGNHDMWLRPNTSDTTKEKFRDSIHKLLALFDVCDHLGAEMFPAEVMENVYVVPLLSWYNHWYDGSNDAGGLRFDKFCSWPMGENNVWEYFLRWNNYFVDRIREAQVSRGQLGHVITFSHFLPTQNLHTPNVPSKAAGCRELNKQIVEVRAGLHIFGHSHVNFSNTERDDGTGHSTTYIQHSLMGPEYGFNTKQAFLVCHENGQLCSIGKQRKVHGIY